jgi:hypothetical protein
VNDTPKLDSVTIRTAALCLLSLVACGRVSEGPGSASPSDNPVYYVDGARPSPGLNEGVELPDSEYLKGCVPWSKERPDVHICGPIADSFEPPPPPGGYSDYPDVCDAAARLFNERAEGIQSANGLDSPPTIDVKTCGAAGLGSNAEGRWMVKFGLANPEAVPPYLSADIQSFTLEADGSSVGIFLSETPWPLS